MNSKQVSFEENEWVTWSDVSFWSKLSAGIINGMVAFYVILTFSWNHQTWGAFLIAPLAASLISGSYCATQISYVRWKQVVVTSIALGLVTEMICMFAFPHYLGIAILTVFGVLLSTVLTLPYALYSDVSNGCVINLRIFTAIAVISVIVFVLNDSPSQQAVTSMTILFTFCMSIGILVAELAFARHIQTVATRLSQKELALSGVGILTIAMILGSVGPIAAFAIVLGFAAVIVLLFLPILKPAITSLMRLMHKVAIHRPHVPSQEIANRTANQIIKPHQLPTGGSHWYIVAIFLALVFAAVLFFLLRRKSNEELAESAEEYERPSAVVIKRDRYSDHFRLEKTSNPVRKKYQARLQELHQRSVTIGKSESPRELLRRIPMDLHHRDDDQLTDLYEQERYGREQTD